MQLSKVKTNNCTEIAFKTINNNPKCFGHFAYITFT